MDNINGNVDGGLLDGFGAVPIGFGMSLAMNERAMTSYAKMTEAQKEKMILQAKDAKSKEEMDRIVSSLALSDEQEIRDLFPGSSIG